MLLIAVLYKGLSIHPLPYQRPTCTQSGLSLSLRALLRPDLNTYLIDGVLYMRPTDGWVGDGGGGDL